ncbi:hypothetical protein ACEPAI_7097 [Sanghuangporus weigelae]
MTPDSCSRELSDGPRVIDASYRSHSDLSRCLSLLDRHRIRSPSFTKSPLSPTQRPVRLSLGFAKATPVPAIPSSPEEHSPLGAFNLTSSAEGHLRSLVTRIASPRTPSKFTDATETEILKTRARIITPGRGRDSGPRQRSAARHDDVPSISRSPSPPKPSHIETRGLFRPANLLCFHLFGKAETYSKLRKPKHYKGKAASRSPPPRGHSSIQPKERPLPLDSTLAVVESASRLRVKCVCVVCGKFGVDYPRCPRCCAAWCSRVCRVSDAFPLVPIR